MVLLLFILGLFSGSFLGVLVDRLPRNETVVRGRSRCEFCNKELKVFDLIPIFSYIASKGKCRYCHVSLPYFYPLIELSTGALFALVYIFLISNFQFSILSELLNLNSLILNPLSFIRLIYYLIIVSGFIVIFVMDLKYGLILDKILLSMTAIILVYLFIFNSPSLVVNFVCGVISFLFFLITALGFKFIRGKDGMGGGDIKLAFVLGFFLGFPNIIIAFYLAFLTGAIGGIILILWKKKGFQNVAFPFGPFLILGALVCLFWGNLILSILLPLLGLPS